MSSYVIVGNQYVPGLHGYVVTGNQYVPGLFGFASTRVRYGGGLLHGLGNLLGLGQQAGMTFRENEYSRQSSACTSRGGYCGYIDRGLPAGMVAVPGICPGPTTVQCIVPGAHEGAHAAAINAPVTRPVASGGTNTAQRMASNANAAVQQVVQSVQRAFTPAATPPISAPGLPAPAAPVQAGLSTGAKVGIGVAALVGVGLLVISIIDKQKKSEKAANRRRRRRRNSSSWERVKNLKARVAQVAGVPQRDVSSDMFFDRLQSINVRGESRERASRLRKAFPNMDVTVDRGMIFLVPKEG